MSTIDDMIAELVRAEVARQLTQLRKPDEDMLSTAQAAAFAGVHEKTIRRWVGEGKLEAHHAGRLLRFRRTDIIAALDGPANDDNLTPETLAARKYG